MALKFEDKGKRSLVFSEENQRSSLTRDFVEKGLGAAYVADVSDVGNPLGNFELRSEVFRRLRSIGGRPGLSGTDARYKIPLSQEAWNKISRYAKTLDQSDFHPTPAQVASILLEDAVSRLEVP